MRLLGSLVLGLLFFCAALATPPTKINVQFYSTKNPPQGTVLVIPGLYVRYPQNTYQLLLFDRSLTKGERASSSIYLPENTQAIKPLLAFQDKTNSKYYWYCKESQSFTKLNADPRKGIIKRLTVIVHTLPSHVMSEKHVPQTIACTYQLTDITNPSQQGV